MCSSALLHVTPAFLLLFFFWFVVERLEEIETYAIKILESFLSTLIESGSHSIKTDCSFAYCMVH